MARDIVLFYHTHERKNQIHLIKLSFCMSNDRGKWFSFWFQNIIITGLTKNNDDKHIGVFMSIDSPLLRLSRETTKMFCCVSFPSCYVFAWLVLCGHFCLVFYVVHVSYRILILLPFMLCVGSFFLIGDEFYLHNKLLKQNYSFIIYFVVVMIKELNLIIWIFSFV